MPSLQLTLNQQTAYERDGYIIVKSFCTLPETDRLYRAATGNESFRDHALDVNDKSGKKSRLSLWFTPNDDVFGYLTRSESLLRAVSVLLNQPSAVCHFHSKLMQKEPRVGGAWEWHQDYGYWYKNQFMFPDQLMSVMIALTPANKENGCLQVIGRSHKLGRINHGFAGEQVGADITMVENALKTMPLVYCELQPGDAIFFHSNLLHRSEANLSDKPRWSIISCYNSASNLAYNETSTAWKVPLQPVPDNALLDWEPAITTVGDFLKKENDPALKNTGWETKANS